MFMSKDRNLRFFIWKHKMLTCCHVCIRITHTVQTGKLYFAELFEKGSGILKRIKCFYLCVMSNAFIFDGFLSMGEICFFIFISKTMGWFNWCLIPKCLGISLFGALERTHCWKSVDVVVVKHYDLLGKIRELYVTSGFSSGTHNSCRLICLRFNPVKMSKVLKTFSILHCG
jgi:hypothetical protein